MFLANGELMTRKRAREFVLMVKFGMSPLAALYLDELVAERTPATA
jgi:hypothetical protein